MDFNKFREITENEIARFSTENIDQISEKYGPEIAQIFSSFMEILQRGGKRNRAVMAMYSYSTFREKILPEDHEIIAKIGLIQELFQTYLLVLDDIMDRSNTRRGGPSAHKILESNFQENKYFGDAEHYGISEAICAGMVGQNLAFRELARLKISTRFDALNFANEMLINTTFGQIMDIHGEAIHENTESKILVTLREKTAFYSFLLPLEIGRILAGNNDQKIGEFFADFAKNAGLAFQLRDDINGLFDDLGKSKKSDISEGKRTILVSFAMKNSDEKSRKILEKSLGNLELSDDDFAKVLAVFVESGAKDYAEKMALKFAKKAHFALDELNKIYDFPDKLAPLYKFAK